LWCSISGIHALRFLGLSVRKLQGTVPGNDVSTFGGLEKEMQGREARLSDWGGFHELGVEGKDEQRETARTLMEIGRTGTRCSCSAAGAKVLLGRRARTVLQHYAARGLQSDAQHSQG
jgi:hypothetical protein